MEDLVLVLTNISNPGAVMAQNNKLQQPKKSANAPDADRKFKHPRNSHNARSAGRIVLPCIVYW